METELGLRSTLFSLFSLVGSFVALQIRSHHPQARMFHELLSRDHEDGRATGSTIAECGLRIAD